MNKLKLIKTLFFLLMFLIVLVLTFIIKTAFVNKKDKPFEVTIEATVDRIENLDISGNYAYMTVANKIHIVDVKNGVYKGVISVKGDNNYGK